MTTHCRPDELMDVADGTRPDTALPHLAVCERCRRDLAGLRAVLADLAAVEVPEPSPLYWDRLSSGVRERVASVQPSPRRWFMLVPWRWVTPAACAVALAMAVLSTRRAEMPRQEPASPTVASGRTVAASAVADPAADAGSPDGEALLAFMQELAENVDLDVVAATDLAPINGTTDAAVADLTVDEQAELHRLLAEALRRPGGA